MAREYRQGKYQSNDKNKLIIGRALYEILKDSFKTGKSKIDCFLGFLNAKEKGITKSNKYLEKIRQENSFDLKKYLSEDQAIEDLFDLGKSFVQNEGPVFNGDRNQSNACAIRCFLNLTSKFEEVPYANLENHTRNILANTYYILGQLTKSMNNSNDG